MQCITVDYSAGHDSGLQCNAVLWITEQCSTVDYSAVPYSGLQCSALEWITVLCRTVHILISRMQSRVVHYSTMKCSAVMGRAVRFRPALVVQCNTVHKVQCSALQCSALL